MLDAKRQLSREYLQILEFIERERGLDFHGWRPGCLMRRIDHRIRTSGANSVAAYQYLLRENPDEITALLDTITINVTEFFRNPEVFEAIARVVIPAIVREAVERDYPRIRCWCAGTANGAEAFTLAILFAEEFSRMRRQVPCIIQATDIDRAALEEAETGRYASLSLKGVPKKILSRYFTNSGNVHVVSDAIRILVRFRYHDMIRSRPLMSNDLILCRNVLIYFSRELQHRVFGNFATGVRTGGYLVLGKVESLAGVETEFESVDSRERIYRKR